MGIASLPDTTVSEPVCEVQGRWEAALCLSAAGRSTECFFLSSRGGARGQSADDVLRGSRLKDDAAAGADMVMVRLPRSVGVGSGGLARDMADGDSGISGRSERRRWVLTAGAMED